MLLDKSRTHLIFDASVCADTDGWCECDPCHVMNVAIEVNVIFPSINANVWCE